MSNTFGTLDALSRIPAPMPETMSPREKVPFMPTVDLTDDMLFEVAPGETLTWGEIKQQRAALASSGDHAELARLAEAAIASGVDGRLPATSPELSAFSAAANPATVLALISEIAALNDYGRSVAKEALGYRDRATEAERKLAEAVATLELAAIRFDEIYEAAEVDDVAYRNEATIHGINGLADVAQAEIRTFLSKEAERG